MNHGGARPNAGRKQGSGRYGEPTKAIRVPLSRVDEILRLLQSTPPKNPPVLTEAPLDNLFWRPLYTTSMAEPASFPHAEPLEMFNLNTYLTPHPERMVFIRIADPAMSGTGIDEGDILIVDQSLPLTSSRIVCAFVNDELLVRRLINDKGVLLLIADNPLYPPSAIVGDVHFTFLGIATIVIHEV
jgi:DNA polymerase V